MLRLLMKIVMNLLIIVIAILMLQNVPEASSEGLGQDRQDAIQNQPIGREALTDNSITVYYFHRNKRCQTCRSIENMAQQTLKQSFSSELNSGKVKWQVVNIETSEGEHFIDDFGLVGSSLVVVNYKDGKPRTWKNLEKVWVNVRDEEKFASYVEEAIRAALTVD